MMMLMPLLTLPVSSSSVIRHCIHSSHITIPTSQNTSQTTSHTLVNTNATSHPLATTPLVLSDLQVRPLWPPRAPNPCPANPTWKLLLPPRWHAPIDLIRKVPWFCLWLGMEGNEEMKAPATVVCLRRWWVAAISAGAPFFLRWCNGSGEGEYEKTERTKEQESKQRKGSEERGEKQGRKEGGAVPACQLVRFGHGSRKLS